MKTLSIQKILIFTVAILGLALTSCKKENVDVQEFTDARDYAVGLYNYSMEWQDVSSGTPTPIDGMEVITGVLELRKDQGHSSTIELWEDGEMFMSFDDVWESPEGFSFNQSWLQLPFEGRTYSFFPYDIFPMEGTTEAGVYYKATNELKLAWFVEINGADLSLTIEGQKAK